MRAFSCLLLVSVAVTINPALSQNIKYIDAGKVIEEADVLYDSGRYEDAIALLKTVPERDTAYAQSLSELIYCYIDSKNYYQALAVTEEALRSPSEDRANLLRLQALSTAGKGNPQEAIALWENAVKEYPANATLLFNLGLAYYNTKDYVKAEDILFKTLAINPFYASAHLNLARLAVGRGRKVHAMLAMGIYLGVNVKDNAHLVMINNFVDNQVQDEGSLPESGTNAPAKLDQLIRAKIVAEEGFESMFPTKAPVIQQYELLFDQLNTIPSSTDDRYVNYYLPLYKAIKENNSVEAFVYHLLTSSSIEAAAKWRNKNEKALTSFYNITNVSLKKHRENLTSAPLGFNDPVNAWFYSSNQLNALGNHSNEKRVGKWIYFHPNSECQAEGTYNDAGEKVGTWKYYHSNGKLKSIENHETGEVTAYSIKGNKSEYFFLKNGEIEGDTELFYEEGPISERVRFAAGKRHGKREMFFPNGTLKASYMYKEGVVDGEFLINYEDGKLNERCGYKAGELHGKYDSYHINGKLMTTGEYKDGIQTGVWKRYHSNGKLKNSGVYNEKGTPVGEWIYYDDNGLLEEKRNYDAEGRYQGDISYYSEGKLHCTSTYKKDILVKDVYYNVDGKVIGTFGGSDGTFASKNYFNTGQLRSEGNYKKGKLEGPWKYYNRFGVLVSEYLYKDNLAHGAGKHFYPSGELKLEAQYEEGELHGYFKEYYRNGKTKQEGWYRNGNREQQWLEYHADGTIESDFYYQQDRNVSSGTQYNPDGKKYFELETDYEGRIVDMRYFNSQGVLTSKKRKLNFVDVYEDFNSRNKLRSRTEVLCGEYDGKLEKFFPDGSLHYQYEFLNGKKNGKYRLNEVSGQPNSVGFYQDDQSTGEWKRYHENGQLYGEGLHRDDGRDSVWTYYHDNGNISSRGPYKNDKRHGVSTRYSPDGLPVLEMRHHNGDLIAYRPMTTGNDAAWISFTGNGKIEIRYANGNKAWEEEYKDGLSDGYDRIYYPDGKLYSETLYSGGDLAGDTKLYYPDGKLKMRGTYKDDERNGTFERYNADGTLESSEVYHLGFQNGKSVYYKNGVKKKEIKFWYGIAEE